MNEGYVAVLYETVSRPANISVLLLEGLAKIRFSLSIAADIFEKQASSKQNIMISSPMKQLVYTAQNVCCDLKINIIDTTGSLDMTGPIIYLMRLLVRQYGMSCLEKVADIYSWVIPKELRNKQVSNCPQPYMLSTLSTDRKLFNWWPHLNRMHGGLYRPILHSSPIQSYSRKNFHVQFSWIGTPHCLRFSFLPMCISPLVFVHISVLISWV